MGFGNCWGNLLPASYKNVATRAPARTINTADFDAEFEAFCAEQRQLKAERQAKEVEETAKPEVEAQATEAVAEEAYQAFVEEDEKPKSKKKKKTEAVVEETSDETPVAED